MPSSSNLLVIYNPVCGDGKAKTFINDNVITMLQGGGYEPENVVETTHPGHAGELIVDFLKKVDGPINVVLASGDGTLHEIVSALYHSAPDTRGRDIKFALVPCGTANALYASLFPETASDLGTDEQKLMSVRGFLTDEAFLPQSAFLKVGAFLSKDAFLTEDDFIQNAQMLTKDDFLQDDSRLSKDDFLPMESFLTKDDLLKEEAFNIDSAPLTKDAFLTKDDFIPKEQLLRKDNFIPKEAFLTKDHFIQDAQLLTKDDFLPKTAFLTENDFLTKDDFIQEDKSKTKKSKYSPFRSLTVAKTTLTSKDGKQRETSSISAVVASTALHASILHDSEALRATHPGIERFKVAAHQNITRWYNASVKLLPPSSSEPAAVQIYEASQNKFVPYQDGGAATLEGPFAYFLSTVNVDRLEPAFRITPLFASLPPAPSSPATLDVVILRPLRDKSIRADSDHDREAFAQKCMTVLGGAYQDGKHVQMRYVGKDGKVVDSKDGEDGDLVVEYFRCGGWEWTPHEKDEQAHLVCVDGEILHVDRRGKATCKAMITMEGYRLAAYI
ncbi:ATP-NAD kinase-like domain-containing protein [Cytidiella melzeri]|nr:ATP-NAD kinase-like domain-containing protein [Cytidiella melzeri]